MFCKIKMKIIINKVIHVCVILTYVFFYLKIFQIKLKIKYPSALSCLQLKISTGGNVACSIFFHMILLEITFDFKTYFLFLSLIF